MSVHLKTVMPVRGSAADVAFVGTSCQTNAVGKILLLTPMFREFVRERTGIDYPTWSTRVFTIGLFCNQNFPKDALPRLINYYGFSPKKVEKIDISEGEMHIHTGNKVTSISITKASKFARGGCKFCPDFWNMCAELSIGNIGSEKGWSTVITRTQRAEQFIHSAEAAGIIELKEISIKEIEKEQKKALKDAKKYQKKTRKGSFLNTLEDANWEQFVEESRKKSFSDLEKEVIDPGLCILCGACEAVCPEKNIIIEERPYYVSKCPEVCGLCYIACPRTHSFLKILSKEPIGIYAARAVRTHKNAQAGGVITELLLYGIQKNVFQTAIVAKDINGEQVPLVTNDPEQVKASAGSKYVTLPQVFLLTKSR